MQLVNAYPLSAPSASRCSTWRRRWQHACCRQVFQSFLTVSGDFQGITVFGHGDHVIRQHLQHVVQALAVGILATLGQILLQVEALDRLAAFPEASHIGKDIPQGPAQESLPLALAGASVYRSS